MKILPFVFNNQYYNNRKQCKNPYLQPLKQDTVNFTAMKKSQFDGFDLAAIEKFKAPIEKFNTKDDFQDWAVNKIFDMQEKNYSGRSKSASIQRMAMLQEWFNYVVEENRAFSPAIALIITDSVRKDLKENNDKLPPVLNKQILDDAVNELSEILKENPREPFDFNKIYVNKLRDFYNDGGGTKWIKIPSKEHDPENFYNNVKKMQVLSHDNWCTKTIVAEDYLSEGDFHIYIENGQPKIAIRIEDGKICEIKGEKNNSEIPAEYFTEIIQYLNRENLSLIE